MRVRAEPDPHEMRTGTVPHEKLAQQRLAQAGEDLESLESLKRTNSASRCTEHGKRCLGRRLGNDASQAWCVRWVEHRKPTVQSTDGTVHLRNPSSHRYVVQQVAGAKIVQAVDHDGGIAHQLVDVVGLDTR